MAKKITSSQSLIKMFRWATQKAFRCYPELYDQNVSDHICSYILPEFMRTDNLYWIKDERGRRFNEIPDMIIEGDVLYNAMSMEKELAVQEHIGNFSLFMSGFFPNKSQDSKIHHKLKRTFKDQLYIELYYNLHATERGLDYYIIQGKKAYGNASKIYKGLNDIKASLLKKLSHHFEAYTCLMKTIHDYLTLPNLNIGFNL